MYNRECLLDKKVSIKDLILNIPKVPRLCKQISDLKKRRINIGNCKLYVEEQGKGVPIVLLHGGPGSNHHYFHHSFYRAKNFARIIYYDQRGCGLSEWKAGKGYSIEQAIDDLEALRKKLNIDKWIVLGHSYGGLLAQCYALDYPERLKGLILVSSAPTFDINMKSKKVRFITNKEIKKIKEILLNKNLTIQQEVYNNLSNGYWKTQFFYKPSKKRMAEIARYEWNHDPMLRKSICWEMKSVFFKGLFDNFNAPTMILEGKWDLSYSKKEKQMLHKNHPNAELIVFENSSHFPFNDETKAFFEKLKNFVDNLN